MKYIVPEYYEHFKCKCGECRHSCCDGWSIRISMKEYYHLSRIECSDQLRAQFDCALKLCLGPRNESYAQISTDWRGICKLHRDDGLCALQVELGESNLPEVCRLYPRSTNHLKEICKSSCSNSCEEVVELLMHLKEPMKFVEQDLSKQPEFEFNISPEKYECCKKSISIIQNRSLTMPERFIALGNFLHGAELYTKSQDNNRSLALQVLFVFEKYYENSISISDYCKESQSYYGMEGVENPSANELNTIAEKYSSAFEHLESLLPDWQILFEQLLVNHMFYNNFPYTDKHEMIQDAFLSLTTMYSFLRFNILGCIVDSLTPDNMVDFLASMFRLIEHSNFKNTALCLIKNEKYQTQECITQLLYI